MFHFHRAASPSIIGVPPANKGNLRWIVLLAVLGVLGFTLWMWKTVSSPTSHVLCAEGGAEWIRMDEPVKLIAHPIGEREIGFRYGFRGPTPGALLTVRAMKNVVVYLDGKELYADPPGFGEWMKRRRIPLPALTTPGTHVLGFVVRAQDCNPAVLAHCAALGIRTSEAWEASIDGNTWQQAMLARAPHTPEIANHFPPAYVALAYIAPWLALVFGIVATLTVLRERCGWAAPPASTIRWYLLLIWALLAANNIFKLPEYLGMDAYGHFEYIRYLAEKGRIPMANEGWQLFQSPLYYLLSAPLYWLLRHLAQGEIICWLRIVPLLCGLAQVELCYRTMRSLFPERGDLQIVGTMFGGFLPMNLYISQVIGNEPLAGVLVSLAIVLVLQQVQRGESCLAPRFAVFLGSVMGLALLTKVSAMLLIPVLVIFCVWWSANRDRSKASPALLRPILVYLVCFGGPIILLAGWYYLRNWVLLGRPFVGGWDRSRGISWWQDHGYVSLDSMLTFGKALVWPIYAQTSGVWNGLYSTFWLDGSLSGIARFEHRPPWNYSFMLGSALLALIPCTAILAGALKGIRQPAALFSMGCIGVYGGAIFSLHLSSLPAYSTIKATYLLGLLPCFAALAATGLGILPRNLWLRATAHGLFACWIVSAYLGYLVI